MKPEMNQKPITPETCFVPRTHEGHGRRTDGLYRDAADVG